MLERRASLAQSVERKALNLVVVGSSPTGGESFSKQATGRIELPTLGLQDQCSATELSRQQQPTTKEGLSRELNPGPLAP